MKQNNPRTVFGTSKKMKQNIQKSIPGVGTYNTDIYDIKRTKKGYSLGKSNRFNNINVRNCFINHMISLKKIIN